MNSLAILLSLAALPAFATQQPLVAQASSAHIKSLASPDVTACRQPSIPGDQKFRVLVSLTVTENGLPEDIVVVASSGNACLDALAQDAVRSSTYRAAEKNGASVASAYQIEFSMYPGSERTQVLVAPVEIIRDGITPPIAIKVTQPTFPHSFFHPVRPNDGAVVLVDLVVGTDGIPENVHVIGAAQEKWNKSAVDAVSRYRFKPAMKDGSAVPVEIHVEVNFAVK